MSDSTNSTLSQQALTRQELYDRIRQTSKEEFILEEMKRLGFWPSTNEVPSVPEQLIRREGELSRELNVLSTENRRLEDQAAMLRALRKQRMEESRKKRAENKLKREQQRVERAAAWKKKQENDIVYLGEKVSGGLNFTEPDREKLTALQLPVFIDATSLAKAMGIPVGELRFMAFSRQTSTVNHYKRFYIAKKSGGQRLISAPMPRLKNTQYWVLQNILSPISLHQAAHGFVPTRSIVSNAKPHLGKEVVINLDLKDFFPTITYARVKGVFKAIGYSETIATLLALICTEPDRDEVVLDGQTYFLASGERDLPQGAPTSPAITNILCYRLDKRLAGLASSLGFTYTRYADDLTFSADAAGKKNINKLKGLVQVIIENEGFIVHPDKTKVMRKSSRQEVTGIIVNEKPGVNREDLKRFRALLFQIEKDGIQGKKWGTSPDILASIQGYANFVAMVDARKGQAFQVQVKQIIEKIEPDFRKRPRKTYPKKVSDSTLKPPIAESIFQLDIPAITNSKKPWWKLW